MGKKGQASVIRHAPLIDPCSRCLFPDATYAATACATDPQSRGRQQRTSRRVAANPLVRLGPYGGSGASEVVRAGPCHEAEPRVSDNKTGNRAHQGRYSSGSGCACQARAKQYTPICSRVAGLKECQTPSEPHRRLDSDHHDGRSFNVFVRGRWRRFPTQGEATGRVRPRLSDIARLQLGCSAHHRGATQAGHYRDVARSRQHLHGFGWSKWGALSRITNGLVRRSQHRYGIRAFLMSRLAAI